MQTSDSLQRKYEELANRYAKQGEARQRDHCLVLAADAALSAGHPDQAERLRKRLLMTNPHHMLRPYNSMSEAMQASDVQDYIADLRRHWPPDVVEKLLKQMSAEEDGAGKSSSSSTRRKAPEPPPPPPKKPEKQTTLAGAASADPLTLGNEDVPPVLPSDTGFWFSVALFVIGVIAAVGLVYVILAMPMLE
jgi:hypothetical protein